MKIATRCVHTKDDRDPYGAIVPPIYQTATFRQSSALELGEYDYTRTANPTRTLLETQLAELENGLYATAFASGMAAITALTRLVANGEEIIAGTDLYGGTVRLLAQILPRQGIIVHHTDTTDLTALSRQINRQTKLILIETPSNPLLRISDIKNLAELAHSVGAWLAVDNSMLSPCLQQPLPLGADLVIHSATKFLSGHSDVTAGAIITRNAELHRHLAFQQNAEGAGLSPFEAWLLLRGIKTLALRVERQCKSAEKIAHFLAQHPLIKEVYYPGLATHTAQALHAQQANGNGAVISFITGNSKFSQAVVEATKLFSIAVSFGAVSSTISLPCKMSHLSIPATLKEKLAPTADLIRISVGIEDADDLIADLTQALTTTKYKHMVGY